MTPSCYKKSCVRNMLTSKVKEAYEYAVKPTCCEGTCKLRFNMKEKYVILKGEKLVSQGKICDCIIFQNDGTIVMVELKSHSLDVSSIVKQLTNGGNKAAKIAIEAGTNEFNLYFILMAKSFGNYSATSRLNFQTVKVGNKTYPIHRSECNKTMNDILNK